ncbi:MAG: MFS transporter [Anaerolineae bacterium]|jgi:predicted MFS family arabinose efflux permease|nr:MFS transporter [Anaerolineae bacterium]MBT7071199.1 MFS transporter [Anaerolineae bacterium]
MERTESRIGFWFLNFFGLSMALIGALFSVRLIVDTSFRMLYPFVPQISAGLGVSLPIFGWLLMIRSSSALLSPFFGSFADRYGRRKVMAFALLSQVIGMLGITFFKGWWAAIPMFFSGLAVNAYLPAQQAYISDLVSFERRGRALASIDVAFAISGVVMMPLIGWIFSVYGWRTPFFGLSALSLIAAWLTWRYLPEAKKSQHEEKIIIGMGELLRQGNVQASLGVATFLFTGVGIFMTFWGIWLTADFGLDSVGLGLVATQIGLSELFGAILAGLLIDRLGKQRSSLMGIGFAAIFFALIPLARENLTMIRIALVLTVFWVEYAIVSLFPLYGEQAPEARASIFSLIALANGIGLAVGPVITTTLWKIRGLQSITSVGAISLGLGFLLIWVFLKEIAPVLENN